MTIFTMCWVILLSQILFIGSRTWNVRCIAEGNLVGALLSGIIIHWMWLVSIAIGGISMASIMNDFEWKYIPVIICSTIGGLYGTYLGMKHKK